MPFRREGEWRDMWGGQGSLSGGARRAPVRLGRKQLLRGAALVVAEWLCQCGDAAIGSSVNQHKAGVRAPQAQWRRVGGLHGRAHLLMHLLQLFAEGNSWRDFSRVGLSAGTSALCAGGEGSHSALGGPREGRSLLWACGEQLRVNPVPGGRTPL